MKLKVSQDIMIVFDISLSMLAEDILPNRITVAKNVVRNFVSERSGDRIGLIIFAGKPFVSIPFSTDYSGIMNIVSGLSTDLIRQDLPGLSGTNIGDALLLANMTHSGGGSPSKSIILLTDGKANTGISPHISADESREKNIKIYTIGIGSLSESDLYYTDSYGTKSYFSDGSGGHLKSDLDESMMKSIAEQTGGKYFYSSDRAGLEGVFRNISNQLPEKFIEKTRDVQSDLTPVWGLLSILCILLERLYLGYILRRYRLR